MLDSECLRILGLSGNVQESEVKKAYRRMVKELHPDTGRRPDSLAFSRVVEAYRDLSQRRFASRIIDFPVRETRTAPPRPRSYKKTAAPKSAERPRTSVFEIGNLLLNGKTPHLRAFAAMRLGNSGRVSSYSYLRQGLYDEDPTVVLASIQAIGKLKVQHSNSELAALFHRGDLRMKLTILDAVGSMKDQKTFKNIIVQGMQDGMSSVRRKSLQLFKKIQY